MSRRGSALPDADEPVDEPASAAGPSGRKRARGSEEDAARVDNEPSTQPSTSSQQALLHDRAASSVAGTAEPDGGVPLQDLPDLMLQVRWVSVTGRTKVTSLPLYAMPTCYDCTGLHKRLVARVFSETQRPASLTCPDYLQWNTGEECLNFPLDVARTSFRLVANHDGWQYVIHESPQHPSPDAPPATAGVRNPNGRARDEGASTPSAVQGNGEAAVDALDDPRDFIHVVSIEFETVARVIGTLGIRLSMVAFPIVAVHKAKLLDAMHRLRTDPQFKGLL